MTRIGTPLSPTATRALLCGSGEPDKEVVIEQALHQKPEGQGYRVTHYVYPPGRHFPEHTHAVEKIGPVRE
jgi:phosphoribosylglycinamide formyltransferase 2